MISITLALFISNIIHKFDYVKRKTLDAQYLTGQCTFEGSDHAIVRAGAQYVAYRSIGVTTDYRNGSIIRDYKSISNSIEEIANSLPSV